MPELPPSTAARSASLAGALALAGIACAGWPLASVAGSAGEGGGAAGAGAPASLGLDALRWQRRLIVAFGGEPARVADLVRFVDENACRLDERDTDVYRVTPDAVDPLSPGAARLDDASRDRLATLARVPDGEDERDGRADAPTVDPFELVLIGKDGGVKRRANAIAALPGFLDAIDGMPMRRAEMARDADDC